MKKFDLWCISIIGVIVLGALSGCNPYKDRQSTTNSSISVYSDNERDVTCWIYSSVLDSRGGLSCIPNDQIRKANKNSMPEL